ncbi:phage terminase large subunit, partial [Inquilinus sp. OTU3971]|uniref:phage terminase large subunit n=1 Tax=Inquilinus sp. OTU3971 TaxID=3043855 RepID=UPI00313ED0E2
MLTRCGPSPAADSSSRSGRLIIPAIQSARRCGKASNQVKACPAKTGAPSSKSARPAIQSVKRLIEDKIQALGLGRHFRVQADRILTPGGGRIIFQGMQNHTAESIKSLEGYDIAWVEEAQALSIRSLDLLRPT